MQHCSCAFICVTHGHRPCILPCTQSTLFDPRSVGHNPPEDLKLYLTTLAKTVFAKFVTVFWEVLTVVAELLENIQRICDYKKELWIQYFEQIMGLFVRAGTNGGLASSSLCRQIDAALPVCCGISCLRQVYSPLCTTLGRVELRGPALVLVWLHYDPLLRQILTGIVEGHKHAWRTRWRTREF